MRTLGEILPMSVGTALAFEGEEGKHAIPKADTFLINLRTLIRNVHGAFSKDDPQIEDIDVLKSALLEDIKQIASTITEIAPRSVIHVEIYYPSYKSLGQKYPHANIWKPRTPKQIALNDLYEKVAKSFIKDHSSLVTLTDVGLPTFKGKGLVITHHPIDIADTESWGRLTLLESHSGVAKPYLQWNSKLTGKETANYNIPLNRMTIQVFGDNSVNFLGQSNAVKKLVRDLAVKAGWTSATTPQRCRSSINTYLTGVDKKGLLLFW